MKSVRLLVLFIFCFCLVFCLFGSLFIVVCFTYYNCVDFFLERKILTKRIYNSKNLFIVTVIILMFTGQSNENFCFFVSMFSVITIFLIAHIYIIKNNNNETLPIKNFIQNIKQLEKIY